MCCEKCTSGGISTSLGKEIFEKTPIDEHWKLTSCPKMNGSKFGDNRVLWGVCRVSSKLERVECCKKCDYFS